VPLYLDSGRRVDLVDKSELNRPDAERDEVALGPARGSASFKRREMSRLALASTFDNNECCRRATIGRNGSLLRSGRSACTAVEALPLCPSNAPMPFWPAPMTSQVVPVQNGSVSDRSFR
jgi:hypothetical protein